MSLKEFQGVITKCNVCTNPEKAIYCKNCFCRGFVAICLACSGTGQITVPVAGAASGDMKSTCDKCGGTGHYGVVKPENWDAEQAPAEVHAETSSVETADDDDDAFKEITAGAAEADAPEDPLGKAYREMLAEQETEQPAGPNEPARPKRIHWKTWEKLTLEQKFAATAVKDETPELAAV